MSLISTESSLLGTAFNKPPSLVFPSLHSNSRTNEPKYSSKEAPNLNSNNNNNEDHSANNKNLQSCIHYASRLIKLRSELRSPSYMNRSNSISESGGDAAGQLFYKSNCTTFGSGRNGRNSSLYELSSTHKSSILDHKSSSSSSNSSTGHSPSLLSDIGRAQSLPNVTQQQDLYHYDKEDESEIFCHHYHNKMVPTSTALPKAAEIENDDEQDDEASQLTYLSVLVRASLRRRQTHFHEASDHLALPPRHHFHHAPNREQRPRSISLRDMINEAIDEAIQSTSANDNTAADKPTVLRNSQSFTLASQLLFHASQNSSSSQQQRQKTDQEKKEQEQQQQQQQQQQQTHQEQEKENLFLDTTNVKSSSAMTNDKFKEVIPADIHHGVFDEKVEISSQATARRATSTSSNTSTFRQCNKQAKTTATTRAAPMPQPSKSRDNKSLFSFISSDSELDDGDDDDDDTKTSLSIHSFNKRIIQKRRLQKRPQAFLVSISPSSAAAASVARSRRSKTKQAIRAHHHLNSLLH